ncbi:hypothetical protein Tco_1234617 [Tanacetum coccineum]
MTRGRLPGGGGSSVVGRILGEAVSGDSPAESRMREDPLVQFRGGDILTLLSLCLCNVTWFNCICDLFSQVKNHNRTGGARQDGLKIAKRIEIRSFIHNKVAIGRTYGWIESYALKFFKSRFIDKPSAKRRRNAICQSQIRSPLRSFRTVSWASLKAKIWNSNVSYLYVGSYYPQSPRMPRASLPLDRLHANTIPIQLPTPLHVLARQQGDQKRKIGGHSSVITRVDVLIMGNIESLIQVIAKKPLILPKIQLGRKVIVITALETSYASINLSFVLSVAILALNIANDSLLKEDSKAGRLVAFPLALIRKNRDLAKSKRLSFLSAEKKKI